MGWLLAFFWHPFCVTLAFLWHQTDIMLAYYANVTLSGCHNMACAFLPPPQVTGTPRQWDTEIPNIEIPVYLDIRALGHRNNRTMGGVGVSTYCNRVVIFQYLVVFPISISLSKHRLTWKWLCKPPRVSVQIMRSPPPLFVSPSPLVWFSAPPQVTLRH